MKIGVLGTGIVGPTIAAKLAALGHEVAIGTRDVPSLMARTELGMGQKEPFSAWIAKNPAIRVAEFSEAAAHGEIVFNATSGARSMEALGQAGADNLSGKIIVDLGNPLDFSRGMPPSLTVCNTDSLGEQIQRAFPDARVVKTLNTVNALIMVNPQQVAGGDHHVFVSGNDAGAKAEVTSILKDWFGWRHVVDLGDITSARAAEMYLSIWVQIFASMGTTMFNIRIVT